MATNTAQTFQPAFKRVAQSNDFDCVFAVIAMVANKTLAEVRQVAVDKFEVPEHGPWWPSESMITGLCAHFGWAGTVYKEASTVADLPDICLLMVDYNPKTEMGGRHILFHRQRAAGGVEYTIDPGFWITDPAMQVRVVKSLPPPLWYIGVHAMNAPKSGNK